MQHNKPKSCHLSLMGYLQVNPSPPFPPSPPSPALLNSQCFLKFVIIFVTPGNIEEEREIWMKVLEQTQKK